MESLSQKTKFQILIARHTERLDYLKFIPPREQRDYEVIVSNSGSKKDEFICDRTITRDNIGREAGHYLDFISSEYENMAETVVFIQAGCFAHSPPETIIELFWGNPQFEFPIGFLGTNCPACVPKVPRWTEAEFIIKTAWQDDPWTEEINGNNGLPWVIGGGAQFYIKKDVILKRPKEHYSRVIECAKEPESKFAHVLEFHWPNMFDLSCLKQYIKTPEVDQAPKKEQEPTPEPTIIKPTDYQWTNVFDV